MVLHTPSVPLLIYKINLLLSEISNITVLMQRLLKILKPKAEYFIFTLILQYLFHVSCKLMNM